MKDEGVYLDHILDCFEKISKYLAHCSYEAFLEDEEKPDAVIRKIEVAGEATKQLSHSFRQRLLQDLLAEGPLVNVYLRYDSAFWQVIQERLMMRQQGTMSHMGSFQVVQRNPFFIVQPVPLRRIPQLVSDATLNRRGQ